MLTSLNSLFLNEVIEPQFEYNGKESKNLEFVSIRTADQVTQIQMTDQQLFDFIETITKGFYDGKSYEDLMNELDEKDRKIEELEEEIRQHKERIEYEKYEDKYDYIRDIERIR